MSTFDHNHEVVSREEWTAKRKALLVEEKALTRALDELARKRRELPWVRVEEQYRFDTPEGEKTLAELFDGQRQLIIYHFMFGPDWENGCKNCSFLADHIDGMLPHLANRDTTLIAVSRAPLEKIERYRQRMGWRFPWASSYGSTFNFDYSVSFTPEQLSSGSVMYNYNPQKGYEELHGISAFIRDDDGNVFHTYSAYARGTDSLLGTHAFLDITALGRNETSASGEVLDWVRRNDEYVPAQVG